MSRPGWRRHTATKTGTSAPGQSVSLQNGMDGQRERERVMRQRRTEEGSGSNRQSNKPGLAATPSIQRCGSAASRQGAAEIPEPAVNTANSGGERDSGIRPESHYLHTFTRTHNLDTHRHRHWARGLFNINYYKLQ